MDLKTGDLVKLKGYVYVLNVRKVTEIGVVCNWFGDGRDVKSETFYPDQLERIDLSERPAARARQR